jgi:uncharacterized membrane protein required for colicin V production
MMQLDVLLWAAVFIFGYIGFHRGWTKEVISLAGIFLGLYALHRFDGVIRGVFLAEVSPEMRFVLQTLLFAIVVFFAYQTRALIGHEARRDRRENRAPLQTRVMGGLVGAVNGYLIAGTIWYLLHINQLNGQYPFAPYVIIPPPGTISATTVQYLPLNILAPNPAGELLSLVLIVLFFVVIVLT